MIRKITVQLLLAKLSRSIWVLAFLGIFVFVGLIVLLDLPDGLSQGEKGQLAIQALDAMRRPFLDIKQLEARALNTAESHAVKLDFENAVVEGRAEIDSYQHLAQYNRELASSVTKMAQQYEVWVAAERNLFEQLGSSPDATDSVSLRRLRESTYLASAHFLRLLDLLGDGEKPIHTDIDRGRASTHRLLSLSAILLLYLGGLLFLHLLLMRRDLELEVARQRADLVDINEELRREIGIRKDAEEKLTHQASHDSLTNLPNRRLFTDRLTQALARAPWRHRLVAVLFLDLDGFKQINDTLGHDAGDELLRDVARRLNSCTRPGDTVARLGGDEFCVILLDIADESDVRRIVANVQKAIRQPFILGGREVHVGSSIGISVHPQDGSDERTLLKNADAAMYHAKNEGKDRSQFYSAIDRAQAH